MKNSKGVNNNNNNSVDAATQEVKEYTNKIKESQITITNNSTIHTKDCLYINTHTHTLTLAQSAWAVEYTDYISAEE